MTVLDREAAVAEELSGLAPARPEAHPPDRGRRRGGRLISYLTTVFVLLTLNFFVPRVMAGLGAVIPVGTR